jgi:hypothetical protein
MFVQNESTQTITEEMPKRLKNPDGEFLRYRGVHNKSVNKS